MNPTPLPARPIRQPTKDCAVNSQELTNNSLGIKICKQARYIKSILLRKIEKKNQERNEKMTMFEVGQVIKVDGEKTKVLGRANYSSPLPEYSIEMHGRSWLEPTKETWRLWKEVRGEGNPIVEAVRNCEADLAGVYGEFHITSHGIATATESIGNAWGVEVGDSVELWRGENMADKEWPLFIVERNKNGVILWAGRYTSVR